MSIEEDLKNLKCLRADDSFKQNLRKRILNEYSLFTVEQKHVDSSSIWLYIKETWQSFFYSFVKFNSALTLSLFILLFVSIGSYASFYILPNDVKTSVSESINSIGKPKIDFEVVSNIEGANVYLNNKFIGTTPLDVDIKEGEYNIRIEKDGYIAYQSDVKLDPAKQTNKVNIELPKQVTSDTWLQYENSENDIKFFYPDSWKLIEKKMEDQNRISQIILENGNTSLIISLRAENDTHLFNTAKDIIYVGEIPVNETKYNRYLIFNKFNEFSEGGIFIDGKRSGDIKIDYYFDDLPQSQILASEQLNILDQITISFLSNQTDKYIYNPNSFKPIANNLWSPTTKNEDGVISEDNNPEYVELPENEEDNNEEIKEHQETYTNTVYGYSLNLPQNWYVSTSRAEYPLHDRGHLIERDGKSYKVSRLKIYTEKGGHIYIFMTNNDSYDINDGGDLCNSTLENRKIKNVDDSSVLIGTELATKYNYQLCKKDGDKYTSVMNYESKKNGNLRYVIYWDASEEEIGSTLDLFKDVINSLKFDDKYVITTVNRVEYTFKSHNVEFNHKYSWNVITEDKDCTINKTTNETKPCKLITLKDGSKTIAEITVGENLLSGLDFPKTDIVKDKAVRSKVYKEVYIEKEVCESTSDGNQTCTDTQEFSYGIGEFDKTNSAASIKYFQNNESVYSFLQSFRLN